MELLNGDDDVREAQKSVFKAMKHRLLNNDVIMKIVSDLLRLRIFTDKQLRLNNNFQGTPSTAVLRAVNNRINEDHHVLPLLLIPLRKTCPDFVEDFHKNVQVSLQEKCLRSNKNNDVGVVPDSRNRYNQLNDYSPPKNSKQLMPKQTSGGAYFSKGEISSYLSEHKKINLNSEPSESKYSSCQSNFTGCQSNFTGAWYKKQSLDSTWRKSKVFGVLEGEAKEELTPPKHYYVTSDESLRESSLPQESRCFSPLPYVSKLGPPPYVHPPRLTEPRQNSLSQSKSNSQDLEFINHVTNDVVEIFPHAPIDAYVTELVFHCIISTRSAWLIRKCRSPFDSIRSYLKLLTTLQQSDLDEVMKHCPANKRFIDEISEHFRISNQVKQNSKVKRPEVVMTSPTHSANSDVNLEVKSLQRIRMSCDARRRNMWSVQNNISRDHATSSRDHTTSSRDHITSSRDHTTSSHDHTTSCDMIKPNSLLMKTQSGATEVDKKHRDSADDEEQESFTSLDGSLMKSCLTNDLMIVKTQVNEKRLKSNHNPLNNKQSYVSRLFLPVLNRRYSRNRSWGISHKLGKVSGVNFNSRSLLQTRKPGFAYLTEDCSTSSQRKDVLDELEELKNSVSPSTAKLTDQFSTRMDSKHKIPGEIPSTSHHQTTVESHLHKELCASFRGLFSPTMNPTTEDKSPSHNARPEEDSSHSKRSDNFDKEKASLVYKSTKNINFQKFFEIITNDDKFKENNSLKTLRARNGGVENKVSVLEKQNKLSPQTEWQMTVVNKIKDRYEPNMVGSKPTHATYLCTAELHGEAPEDFNFPLKRKSFHKKAPESSPTLYIVDKTDYSLEAFCQDNNLIEETIEALRSSGFQDSRSLIRLSEDDVERLFGLTWVHKARLWGAILASRSGDSILNSKDDVKTIFQTC